MAENHGKRNLNDRKKNTWELVDIPREKEVVSLKWTKSNSIRKEIFKSKKARLVARGFTQKSSIDFNETFFPVARLETIRTVIVVVAQKKWKIFQPDVKSTFQNGKLDEEIYVEQPQ